MPTYIYGLIDPTNNKISYIGKTNDLYERWQAHVTDPTNCLKAQWIRRLAASGIKPTVVILEEIPEGGNWDLAERFWITHGLRSGWPLSNTVYNSLFNRLRDFFAPPKPSSVAGDWPKTEDIPELSDEDPEVEQITNTPLPVEAEAETVEPETLDADAEWGLPGDPAHQQIRELAAKGVSRNSICAIVYGAKTPRTLREVNQALVDDATTRRNRILALAAVGMSRSDISREVFGHKDGGTMNEIREVLGEVRA